MMDIYSLGNLEYLPEDGFGMIINKSNEACVLF